MDETRKRFEAWVGVRLRLGKDSRGDYLNYEPEIAWQAYQAGRAAGFAEAREAAVKVCKDSAGYDGGIRKALDEILALEPK